MLKPALFSPESLTPEAMLSKFGRIKAMESPISLWMGLRCHSFAVLPIALVSAFLLTGCEDSASQLFARRSQCATLSASFRQEYLRKWPEMTGEFTNRYDSEGNRCYVEFSGANHATHFRRVYDAQEGKALVDCLESTMSSDHSPSCYDRNDEKISLPAGMEAANKLMAEAKSWPH